MKRIFVICLVTTVLASLSGCLVTGQITLVETVHFAATGTENVYIYQLDLNDNQDYLDNKDSILSVDALALVAIIKNRLATAASGEVWFTPNQTTHETVSEIKGDKSALRIVTSPKIPGESTLTIKWNDAFSMIENEDAVAAEVLGDGIMTFYGIADVTPFDLFFENAEVQVTVTVEK